MSIRIPDGYDLIDSKRESVACFANHLLLSKFEHYQLLCDGTVAMHIKSRLTHKFELVAEKQEHH
jgi:hypothetical protein